MYTMRSLFPVLLLVITVNCVYGHTRTCSTHYTAWTPSGKGHLVYLDRQRVNCGHHARAMSGFRMQSQHRKDDVYIRYRFICCSLNRKYGGLSKQKYTNFDLDGKGNAVYLDRQRVDCGTRGLINDFWVRRNRPLNRIRYHYYCNNANSQYKVKCYSTSASCFTYDGKGKLYYLDRQNAQCKRGYSLSAFRLYRNSALDSWKYWYRCCSIQG